MDEVKDILAAILHRLEIMDARLEHIEGALGGFDRRITDNNHRIADLEQKSRLA